MISVYCFLYFTLAVYTLIMNHRQYQSPSECLWLYTVTSHSCERVQLETNSAYEIYYSQLDLFQCFTKVKYSISHYTQSNAFKLFCENLSNITEIRIMGVIRNVITTDCVLCRQQLFNDQLFYLTTKSNTVMKEASAGKIIANLKSQCTPNQNLDGIFASSCAV